jgi:hypothetical protein
VIKLEPDGTDDSYDVVVDGVVVGWIALTTKGRWALTFANRERLFYPSRHAALSVVKVNVTSRTAGEMQHG